MRNLIHIFQLIDPHPQNIPNHRTDLTHGPINVFSDNIMIIPPIIESIINEI